MNIKIAIRVGLLICSYSQVFGNDDCHKISDKMHQVQPEDFKVSRYDDKKYVMCNACFSSTRAHILPLKLNVFEVNSTTDDLVVYMGTKHISFSKPCTYCHDSNSKVNSSDMKESCVKCQTTEPTKDVVEVHVRLDKPDDFDPNDDQCLWDMNFNMTVHLFSCMDGLLVNRPKNSQCQITESSLTKYSESVCINQSAVKHVFLNNSYTALTHEFSKDVTKDFILWHISKEISDQVELHFDPIVKGFLTIYDEDVLVPTFQLKHCANIETSFVINSTTKIVNVLFENDGSVPEDALLRINIPKISCPHLSTLNNGFVELSNSPNGTIVHFSCIQGYLLQGPSTVLCHSDEKMPTCIPSDLQGNFMSDQNHKPNQYVSDDLVKGHFPNVAAHSTDLSFKQPLITILEKSPIHEKVNAEKDPTVQKNNASEIIMDILSTSGPASSDTLGEISMDGSGFHSVEEDEGFMDASNVSVSLDYSDSNITLRVNRSLTPEIGIWVNGTKQKDFKLLSYPAFVRNLKIFLGSAAGLTVVVICIVIALVIRQNRINRAASNRKFDTFQNPIYEKSVVPLSEADTPDAAEEKIDLANLSDCTVLE